MIKLEYWISELAERTGVSVRTIRYYIEEGLLPQPEIRGRYAVFTDAYLDRLELIRLLKEKSYMPLREIKEQLGNLDDAQVRAFLSDQRRRLNELPLQDMLLFQEKSIGEKDSAEEYINRVLKVERKPRINYSRTQENPPAPAPHSSPEPNMPSRETWQRIVLAPGMELHVQQPLTSGKRRLINRLIEMAKNQLEKEREEWK